MVQLFRYNGETETEAGLTNILFDTEISDSGRAKAFISKKVYMSVAKVLKTSHPKLSEGDIVFVSDSAVKDSFVFHLMRDEKVLEGNGVMLIPNTLILSKF